MPLDPALEAMLKQMAEAEAPALSEMSPVEAREMYRAMQQTLPTCELHSVADDMANNVPVRVYRPSAAGGLPCLVFFHGGGWVIGDLDTHDSVCRQLAARVQCVIVSVDYRLAPEHPFPAPLDDCYQALRWVVDNADKLNIDPTRVAVGGDSAGGNLSAAVSLKSKMEGGPSLSYQLLIYPVTDTAMDTPSYEENKEGYMLTRDSMVWFWNQYLGTGEENRRNPLAAPLRADDHSGLPPACVITAEFDPLRDEGERLGEKLAAAGVETTIERFDGMIHGFFGMTHLVEGAREAMDLAALRLKTAFREAAKPII